MIHPDSELKPVDPTIGAGVFATRPIRAGTITYAWDPLEIVLKPEQLEALQEPVRGPAHMYAVRDENGNHIVSWDLAKYVNHRCDCNTMSTGWGFEIALRDIAAGEQITDEYGLFNLPYEMPVACGCHNCRGVVRPEDVLRYHREWDARVQQAFRTFQTVEQPLLPLLPAEVHTQVSDYLAGTGAYKSVLALYFAETGVAPQPDSPGCASSHPVLERPTRRARKPTRLAVSTTQSGNR